MRRVLIVLTVVVALAGCATAPPPPADAFYRLDVAAPAPAPRPLVAGVVEVQPFTAQGLGGERAVVYSWRDRPQEVGRYATQFWAERPAVLLQDALVGYLRAANVAPRVVTPELRAVADAVVQGRVNRFEQVVGAATTVVVEVQLSLTRTRESAPVVLETYRVERACADGSVPAAVAAANAAVGELFGRFLRDLAARAAP